MIRELFWKRMEERLNNKRRVWGVIWTPSLVSREGGGWGG